jgi:plasmid stabilization system protein ParE
MKRYAVGVAEGVRDDLVGIERWHTEQYGDARAYAVVDSIMERIDNLQTLPLRGARLPELAHLSFPDYREVVKAEYRIIYRVTADTVLVLAVIHQRRTILMAIAERLM